jgi:Tol biopolymer transport system component/DNA-binding winged helix-turn-helix (wHTH) protein
MAEAEKSLGSVRFGPFELSLETQELRKHGVPLKVSGQAIQVLAMLTANPGKLVTREELRKKLWPAESFGDFEHGLNAAVNKLREKLGDSATTPTYIETLQGRGYRFIAKVEQPVLLEPPGPAPVELKPPRGRRKWRLALAILAFITLVVGLLYPWLQPLVERQIRVAQLQRLTVAPLTSLPGNVMSPTFSPDGNEIAFAWDGENNGKGFDLYVKVIGNEKPLRLTNRPGAYYAAWSPDGKSIAMVRNVDNDENSGVYLISPLGGTERKIMGDCNFTNYGNVISWSPDGKQLVCIRRFFYHSDTNAMGLFTISLDSLQVTPVKTNCNMAKTPAFSPQGDYLAWSCVDSSGTESIELQRLSDGTVTRLLRRIDIIGGLTWSRDGNRIIFSSRLHGGDIWEVWLADPDHPIKLPVGHDATDLAVSAAGNRLAFAQNRTNTNIWRLDLAEPQPQARKAIASSREQTSPNISPDGKRISFGSNRSGSNEVWVSDADGSNAVQLSSFGVRMTGTPRWSPDSKLIAFDSRAGGEANIYLVDPRGGVPRKLNIDIRGNTQPSWSRDGAWIYFVNGADAHAPTGWKVPSTGGHAVPITQGEVLLPVESPDGQVVYFIRQARLWSVTTDGTDERQVEEMPETMYFDAWAPVSSGIYFMGYTSGKSGIEYLDLKTKKVRLLYAMEKDRPDWIGGMPVSSDGKWLYFPQVDEQSSDLMMIENWN